MRKIIITLLLLVPFLSGCATINANLSIKNNKSANIEVSMYSDKQARPQELKAMSATFPFFVDKSYIIKDNSTYKKNNVKATKAVKNLSKNDLDLSSLGFATKLPSGRYIDVKHNFFVTLYNINMVYNLKNMQKRIVVKKTDKIAPVAGLKPEYFQKYGDDELLNEAESNTVSQDFFDNLDENLLSELGYNKPQKTQEIEVDDDYKLFDINNLDAEFSITLPAFASYNNADKVNGNVYTWTLNKTAPTEIKLQYVVYSGWAIFLMIFAGIGLLIYLAHRIHKHETLKRIGNNN